MEEEDSDMEVEQRSETSSNNTLRSRRKEARTHQSMGGAKNEIKETLDVRTGMNTRIDEASFVLLLVFIVLAFMDRSILMFWKHAYNKIRNIRKRPVRQILTTIGRSALTATLIISAIVAWLRNIYQIDKIDKPTEFENGSCWIYRELKT